MMRANNNELPPTAKLLYGILYRYANNSLASSNGFCWPSNKVLSEILHITEKQIERLLKKLEIYGAIDIPPHEGKIRKIYPQMEE